MTPWNVMLKKCDRSKSALIVAPYMKADALRRVLEALAPEASVTCITRWTEQDIRMGASDIECRSIVVGRRGSFLLHENLHAKYYRFDKSVLVGSANLTASGLGYSGTPNLEILWEPAPTFDTEAFEGQLQAESREVSETEFQAWAQVPLDLVELVKGDAHESNVGSIDPEASLNEILHSLWPGRPAFFHKYTRIDDGRIRTMVESRVGQTVDARVLSLLEYRLNQGKAERFLILTPPNSARHWEKALYDRLNISVPVISVPVIERQQDAIVLTHLDGNENGGPDNQWLQPRAIVSMPSNKWRRVDANESAKRILCDDIVIVDKPDLSPDSTFSGTFSYFDVIKGLSPYTRDFLLVLENPVDIEIKKLWCLMNTLQGHRKWYCWSEFKRLMNHGVA